MRTTLDWDTVEASIPSLFRGPDVMITACGWPGKAAARTRGGEGGGPAVRLLLTRVLKLGQPGCMGAGREEPQEQHTTPLLSLRRRPSL